jgi:DNA-binding transcriptional LysR family regulator
MDRLEAIRVFCAVIEAGGFAAAADHLGLSTSAVSRYVAQLEAHLHVRLLQRTTRRVSATEQGYAYFERCTQLLADLDEADRAAAGTAYLPRGRLRLTAPVALAARKLAPAFAAFAEAYPQVSMDIVASDNVADFIEEGLDLAIRVGRIGSDNLVARRIGFARLLTAASPGYLGRTGVPASPQQLTQHVCLTYAHAAAGQQWPFTASDGTSIAVRVAGPIHADSGILLAELAAAGAGFVQAPDFILQPLLDSGRLVEVLGEWASPPLAVHVVYPTRRHLSAKVQAMTTFLGNWWATHGAPAGVDSGSAPYPMDIAHRQG